jgi:two-component system, OmpR family, response regulator QseB
MRLLLVEDDPMIGESLVKGLRDEGYAVDWVRDGPAGLAALGDARADFSVVVLDWNLPRQNGLSVLQGVRAAVADRIKGLDGGADDYLVKPFELAELKARLRSLLRRRDGRARSEIVHGQLVLDPVMHTARLRDVAVAVTPREFALLRVLMQRPGAVLSRAQLEEHLYGWDETVQSNAIEFLIHGLRKKLGSTVIENVRGVGWRMGNPA